MENINAILLILQVLFSVSLITLVLLQHGKGADAGAAFGSGASATVFGAKGSGNFLTKSTAIIATLFFATSLTLAYMASHRDGPTSIVDSVINSQPAQQQDTILNPTSTQGDLPPADVNQNGMMKDSDLPPAN